MVLVAVIFFWRGPLVNAGLSYAVRLAGYNISYSQVSLAPGRLAIVHPDVSSFHGEPVFTAERLQIAYSLRDVFGSSYLYGVHGIELDRPKFTLIHHRDSSYNVNLPANSAQASSKPFSLPRIALVLRNGSIGVLDDTRLFAHSRKLALENIQASANLQPSGRSQFRFSFAVSEEGGQFPFTGRGTLDEVRGFEMSHISARSLGIAPLLDFVVNSSTLHFANGVVSDLDLRMYGLVDRHGIMQRHLTGTAKLDHFQPYLGALTKPLRDGRGRLIIYDDGVTIPKVDGSIAGVPVRIAGAIYQLSSPKVRLGIAGKGPLRNLLTLSDAGKKLPLRGPMAFRLLVEGDATQPTTFATFSSPKVFYNRIPLDRPNGLIALHGQATTIVRSALHYDGIAVSARGRVFLAKHTKVEMFATVDAPAERLPYARDLLGPMRVQGAIASSGLDARLASSGVFAGDTPQRHFGGTFQVDGNGEGTIGPIVLDGPGQRTLYARFALDRPRAGGGAVFVSARNFEFSSEGSQPELPGISIPSLAPLAGTLDADAVVAFSGKHYAAGGNAHLYDARALGYPIDDLRAQVAATDLLQIAAEVRYRGRLGPLARGAGARVTARGYADIPVSILADGKQNVLAQIHDARFTRASIAGVALDRLEGTIGMHGKRIDVYAARLRLQGNDVVAQGSFGNGGTLAVSAANIDLAALRSLGLGVDGGDVSAVASVSGTASAPRVVGGLAANDLTLPNPRYAGLTVNASTSLTYAKDRLQLRNSLVRAGPAVGTVDGSVSGLRGDPRAARLDLDAHVRQADVGTLAQITKTQLAYPEGTLNADLALSGTAGSPHVTGSIGLPEGSVNGLRFRDASLDVAGGMNDLQARAGRVTIGSSTLGFDGDLARGAQAISLRAPRVDLADLNDYFDQGDTLGGRGSIFVSARNDADGVMIDGRVRLAHTRFHRFDIGDTRAEASSRGRTVTIDAALGSTTGRVSANGNILLPETLPLRNTFQRSSLALRLRAENVDLRTWLPAAEIHEPVTGFVNANATLHGIYPNVAVSAHADLQDAVVQRIAIRTASLDARAATGRVTITRAVLAIDNLNATASGSLGLRPADALDLTLSAQTPDAGALAKTLTGKTYDASGSASTTLHVTGNPQRPLLAETLDGDKLRYERFTLPHAHAEIRASQTRAMLVRSEIDLESGRVLAAGYAPIQSRPFYHIGPAAAPLALNLQIQQIALAQFAGLLPKGTSIAGELNGNVDLGGSLANPGLNGMLALSDGAFEGPQERSKISAARAQLALNGRTLTIQNTSATVGGGTIDASGRLTLANLQDPVRYASANLQLDSNGAVFDLPQYFRGRANGTLTYVRNPEKSGVLGGKLTFSSARIPPTALISSAPRPEASAAPTFPLALNLAVTAGDDVRVQGGPIDIGAKGRVQVGGTLASPALSGVLVSTGGTLSFYRTFQLQYPSKITFDPSDGVIPDVDATATSYVSNPPTNVSLHVTGRATHLNVDLASDPNYSREQILGILVGAASIGAVSGVQTVGGGSQVNPFQAAASGELGSLLTQNLLEPFSSQFGSSVGLNSLAINYAPGTGGGFNISARKKLFKDVNAVFAESFNYPQRQSIGILASPNDSTAIQLTFFSQPYSNRFDPFEGSTNLLSTNPSLTSVEPANGTTGFALSFQRKFR